MTNEDIIYTLARIFEEYEVFQVYIPTTNTTMDMSVGGVVNLLEEFPDCMSTHVSPMCEMYVDIFPPNGDTKRWQAGGYTFEGMARWQSGRY